MRSNLVGALALLAVSCGGDDSSGAVPYDNNRCGDIPSGVWQVTTTGAPRALSGQTMPICQVASSFMWDFAVAMYMNTYDQGCALQCTEVFNGGDEVNDLEVMWVTSDKWSGTVKVEGLNGHTPCVAIVDVTLTKP